MKSKVTSIQEFLYKHKIILFHFLLGVVFRFLMPLFGHNFDFDSYKIVGEIASRFGNVYAETGRYNYGPIFLCFQGFFYRISALLPHSDFFYRYFIVSLLTCTDIGIALYIYKRHSRSASILFFLNPVSIIITGYHNQFDNMAVLLLLIALLFYNTNKSFNKRDLWFVFFMILSLMTKHLAVFFLFWIFMRNDLVWKKRLVYTGIPVFIFLISFIPFFHDEGIHGIIHNVFLYRSFNNLPLFHFILKRLHVPSSFYFYVFISLLCASGVFFRKIQMDISVLLYTICLVAFSSAVANQYLIIPLAALFIISKYAKYTYSLFIGIYLLLENNGLHFLNIAKRIDSLYSYLVRFEPFINFYIAHSYSLACFILFIVIIIILLKNKKAL
jgi:hypothetical protein